MPLPSWRDLSDLRSDGWPPSTVKVFPAHTKLFACPACHVALTDENRMGNHCIECLDKLRDFHTQQAKREKK